jgi:hypothetical protein
MRASKRCANCSPESRYTDKNPARVVAYRKSNNPDGFRAWSQAHISKHEARHRIGTKAWLALDLLLSTGVRPSDVVKLGPQVERDGKLIFSETKGRARIRSAGRGDLRRACGCTLRDACCQVVTTFTDAGISGVKGRDKRVGSCVSAVHRITGDAT